MKTFKERFDSLGDTQKEVALILMKEIVACVPLCNDHIIDKDNGTYDEVGTAIFTRLCSNGMMLAGLMEYKDHNEVFEVILSL